MSETGDVLVAQQRPPLEPDRDRRREPVFLRYVWAALVVLLALQMANDLLEVGGSSVPYDVWFQDVVLAASAALVLARAFHERRTRSSWLAFGLAGALWLAGSAGWSLAYGGRSTAPYPTFADALWLMWYPLMAFGIARLIRLRFSRIELHRWMDGMAVMILVIAAGSALVIQPVASQSHQGTLATVVDFSYPVLDLLVMGAVLGIFAVLGWRPERMWLFIGLGLLSTTIADAVFAVQQAHGVTTDARYSFVWSVGAVCVAYAAWVPSHPAAVEPPRVTGFRAIALPLIAQALAAGIQLYAFFEPIGRSERIVTLGVLAVASVQIILTRPRPPPTAPDRDRNLGSSPEGADVRAPPAGSAGTLGDVPDFGAESHSRRGGSGEGHAASSNPSSRGQHRRRR